MKIIMLFSPKGGASKSTTSMLLANTLSYHYGKSVAIFSTDKQGTPPTLRYNDTGGKESDEHYEIIPTNESYFYESILPDRKNLEKEGYDYLIVDSPGHMTDISYLTALKVDLVLVPVELTRPGLEDFFGSVVDLITKKLFSEDASCKNKVYWFASKMDKRTADYKDFMDCWKDWEKQFGIKILQPGIEERSYLKKIDTISFPEEDRKDLALARETMINFTDAILKTFKN